MFLWVLMAFLVVAGLGLFLVEVDVVVSARGKIVPLGDVKTLQPLETGVVSGIRVKEGDYVAQGATLVEVDPALDTADLEGKEAVSADGLSLGRITGILDTAAHPILVVTGRGREYLVPVYEGVVAGFDEEQVVLRLPPGLLEINDL